ncbi:NFATC2-interacting protein isoform X1 [Peromyscus californicus insignis]|uniref:NFATC2-interacting protein isoform X1 n=1 Tax=Peromyscus californicus insignis TaxID=564181 RepID=UPI0022A77CA7|nr:NFATC2-interacting protein isoform X1 [Peromyscus californicus insignis]
MAEPGRRRGPRSRGGGAGRGARRARVARSRRPRAPQSLSRLIPDTVLVDLVSDSDEEILEVVADPVEVPAARAPAPAAHGQDSDSDSEGADEGPAAAPQTLVRRRRRRLLDPGEAPVVPVYSGKVQSSLNLIPDNSSLLKLCPSEPEDEADVTDCGSPPPEDARIPGSPWKKKLRNKHEKEEMKMEEFPDQDISPLPRPSSRNKSRKHTEALQKLREVNKRLQDLRSCLSPKQHQSPALQNPDDEVVLVEGPALSQSPRLFTLKIRCRADLVRLPVMTSEPLQNVVDYMANHLGVSPSRILLLFGETELSPTATPRTLKLGVADIIDCVVLTSSSEATETSQQLRLRVQGKEKHQMLEISLSPDSPLEVLMSHYEEAMGLSGHKLSFFFDGTKLSGKELPADLGMESGDLIEVWG